MGDVATDDFDVTDFLPDGMLADVNGHAFGRKGIGKDVCTHWRITVPLERATKYMHLCYPASLGKTIVAVAAMPLIPNRDFNMVDWAKRHDNEDSEEVMSALMEAHRFLQVHESMASEAVPEDVAPMQRDDDEVAASLGGGEPAPIVPRPPSGMQSPNKRAISLMSPGERDAKLARIMKRCEQLEQENDRLRCQSAMAKASDQQLRLDNKTLVRQNSELADGLSPDQRVKLNTPRWRPSDGKLQPSCFKRLVKEMEKFCHMGTGCAVKRDLIATYMRLSTAAGYLGTNKFEKQSLHTAFNRNELNVDLTAVWKDPDMCARLWALCIYPCRDEVVGGTRLSKTITCTDEPLGETDKVPDPSKSGTKSKARADCMPNFYTEALPSEDEFDALEEAQASMGSSSLTPLGEILALEDKTLPIGGDALRRSAVSPAHLRPPVQPPKKKRGSKHSPMPPPPPAWSAFGYGASSQPAQISLAVAPLSASSQRSPPLLSQTPPPLVPVLAPWAYRPDPPAPQAPERPPDAQYTERLLGEAPVPTTADTGLEAACTLCDKPSWLFLCDGCDKPFHFWCVRETPPTDKAWYCGECATEKEWEPPKPRSILMFDCNICDKRKPASHFGKFLDKKKKDCPGECAGKGNRACTECMGKHVQALDDYHKISCPFCRHGPKRYIEYAPGELVDLVNPLDTQNELIVVHERRHSPERDPLPEEIDELEAYEAELRASQRVQVQRTDERQKQLLERRERNAKAVAKRDLQRAEERALRKNDKDDQEWEELSSADLAGEW